MSQLNEDVTKLLRDNGFSVTKQRLFIFGLLEGQEPLTMYELYDRAKGQLDRASVYRIVSVFEKLGIVQRINIGWKYKIELSDRFSDHHHHLTCLRCHTVIPISEDDLESFIGGVSASHKFKPVEHQVEVQGYCEGCAQKST